METVPQVALLDHDPDALLDDDQLLALTQTYRRGLIREVTKCGTSFPSDPKEAKVLLTALSDMDRQALTKKRIVSDEKIASESAEQIEALSKAMMKQMQQLRDENPPIEGEFTRVLEFDDSNLPELQLQDGEMEVGVHVETFDDFRKRHESKYGKPKHRQE